MYFHLFSYSSICVHVSVHVHMYLNIKFVFICVLNLYVYLGNRVKVDQVGNGRQVGPRTYSPPRLAQLQQIWHGS